MLDARSCRAAAARDPFRRGPPIVVPLRFALALDGAIFVAVVVAMIQGHLPRALLGFFAVGLGIGISTNIPIGIANVIVIDAATRFGARRALGASIGGSLADGIYASLGIFGVGPLIDRYRFLPVVLHAISGCVLVVYGVALLRSRPAIADPAAAHLEQKTNGHLLAGFGVGLAATLLNPSAIVTWVVIVGTHANGLGQLASGAWVAGIVIGTFAWFLVVMYFALRGRRVLREKALWMTRIVAAALVASGLFSLARAALA